MITFEIQKLLKNKNGMSMEKFSEQLDLEPGTLYAWNQGRSLPKLPTLFVICHLLGATWSELGEYITIRPTQKG